MIPTSHAPVGNNCQFCSCQKQDTAVPTRNVNLTDHFDRFVETSVSSGRFSNASEVVREGLRLLEQREQEDRAKLKWMRAAAKGGFDALERGDSVALRSKKEVKDSLRRIRKGAAAGTSSKRKSRPQQATEP
jgi:antitoxin ParD1/3/4